MKRQNVFMLARHVSSLAFSICRRGEAKMLAKSLGKILGTREPAVKSYSGNIIPTIGKQAMSCRFKPKPPGKCGDSFTDHRLEYPVKVKPGEGCRFGNIFQREIGIQIPADIVHRKANPPPVLHRRILHYLHNSLQLLLHVIIETILRR
jgi:hypothetical protein